MKDTPTHVGEQYALLITAELIRLGVSFTITAGTDKHGRVFAIGTDGRGELVSEICRIVSERLARDAAYKHHAVQGSVYVVCGCPGSPQETGKWGERWKHDPKCPFYEPPKPE